MTSLERKILGHHWDSENAMPLTYSRDALADALAKFFRVVKSIKDGHFDPDASRAARVAAGSGGAVLLPETEPDAEDVDPPMDGPEHESDVEDDDIVEASPNLPLPQVGQHERPGFPDVSLENCRQRRVSGIVHLLETDESFLCGRQYTLNYLKPTFLAEEIQSQSFCENCHRVLVTVN